MRETPNHWFPRLTATSTVAVRSNRSTSIPAGPFAQIAVIAKRPANGSSRPEAVCQAIFDKGQLGTGKRPIPLTLGTKRKGRLKAAFRSSIKTDFTRSRSWCDGRDIPRSRGPRSRPASSPRLKTPELPVASTLIRKNTRLSLDPG
jgi:hypothetical protein